MKLFMKTSRLTVTRIPSLNFSLTFSPTIWAIGAATPPVLRGVYIGWVGGEYNVGDDAVYVACVEALTHAFAEKGVASRNKPL